MIHSIRKSFIFLGALLLISLMLLIGLAIQQQRGISSTAEQSFVAKDVVADILPPPMYLVELRMVISSALEGTVPPPQANKEYERLASEYQARVQYWEKNPPFGLEKNLLGKQHETAQAFLAQSKTDIFDKLLAGDQPSAKANLTKIHALFEDHHAAVNDSVQAGAAFAEKSVASFNSQSKQSTYVLFVSMGGIFIVFFFLVSRNLRDILQPLSKAADFAAGIASGDLTRSLAVSKEIELAQLQTGLINMQSSLRTIVGEVRESTESINHSSNEIAHGNLDLSQRTEQTAVNLQEAASSMQRVTDTAKLSADNAKQANQLASSAAKVAARGGTVVSQVVTTMEEINTSSKKISDIISVIDGIAFQTNILALNAAVEAARAGEQGRGFAVVASEVRSLAGRSADAAKEIKSLIGASVERVETGSRLVEDAGATMQEIVTSVQRVSDIISEITSASSEQSEGITQVGSSVMDLDQMTQQNAALVEQATAAAESLRDQANKLSQVVGTFKLSDTSNPSHYSSKPAASPKPLSTMVRVQTNSGVAIKPKASTKAGTVASAASTSAASPATKPSSASPSNDDWETF